MCTIEATRGLVKAMTQERSDYLSFLLRLWRVRNSQNSQGGAEEMVWRASLQDTLTDEQVSFASLEDLVAFLRRQMGSVSDADQSERGAKT
jgi:hypothetical protein